MNKIHQYPDKTALVQGFTSFFKQLFTTGKERYSIALSGGSTPKALFEHWAKAESTNIPWEQIHFYWGDERCVPPDDPESNFGMTKQFLFNHIPIPESNLHRILGENTPAQESERYSQEITQHVPVVGQLPQFDLVILGMGDDGHTASIFPHQIELWDSPHLCEVATHPISGQQRVTVTGKLINHAAHRAFLIAGAGKAEKVGEVLHATAHYPASLVQAENTHWFLDDAAGANI